MSILKREKSKGGLDLVHYLVQYRNMVMVNVHQAKTQFSRYLALVARGKRVVLCKRNVPIAEICKLKETRPKRAIGLCKTKFEIPDSFFEPLPDKILARFNNPR